MRALPRMPRRLDSETEPAAQGDYEAACVQRWLETAQNLHRPEAARSAEAG
jgi:hypothetical protein